MATVKVACKLPNGLTVDHSPPDSGKTLKFRLNGANGAKSFLGYGVTDVDADAFESWLANEGKDFAAVKKGLIFALPSKDGDGAVKERASDKTVKTGIEPIDPTKPAKGVEPTDEQKRELAKLDEEPAGQTVNMG